MLVGEPLWDGYATVEFTAPAELVFATDYGAWNDFLSALFDGCEPVLPRGTAVADELVQVCLPVVRAGWVREVRPLPRSADEVTDRSANA